MRAAAPLVCVLLAACSKSEPPSPGETKAETTSKTSAQAEPTPSFDPNVPSFKCGAIRCNLDYYCVQRKVGDPSALCTTHPPGKHREGCMKVSDRGYVCETFP